MELNVPLAPSYLHRWRVGELGYGIDVARVVRRENRRMACIATVFGLGLGGGVSVSNR